MFFVFYFLMTGLHAIHMMIGEADAGAPCCFAPCWEPSTAEYHTPIELAGLYWHFVDIVWVFLYAIFYIPGLHYEMSQSPSPLRTYTFTLIRVARR